MTLMPPSFDYQPVEPFNSFTVDADGSPSAGMHEFFIDAANDIYRPGVVFGGIVDNNQYLVACYRQGFMFGVSAMFEVISDMTVEHQAAFVYRAMLNLEMHWRMNWPKL